MPNPLSTAVARMQYKSITGAQMIPIHQDRQPQWAEWNTAKAVKDGFKASAIVFACVSKLMQAAASLPWLAFTRKGEEWEPAPESPLSELLANPNPFMSRQEFMERLTASMYLGGNAMQSKIMVRGAPVELWPVDVAKVRPVPSIVNYIERYDFDRGDGRIVPLDPAEVVHHMFVDPSNPFWGISPLQAAARTVDTDLEMVRWNKVTMQNRAIPDGVFSTAQIMTREQFDLAREMVREQWQGEGNARTPIVMSGGSEFHQLSLTPAEMDFLESRRHNREEIAAVYGVPLPLIIAQRENTYANYETARKAFWADTVKPFMTGIAEGFTRSLVPHFGDRRSLMVAPDYSEVEALRADLSKKIADYAVLVQHGVPPNAAAQRLELDIDDIEGGDVGLIGATMVPLTMAGEGMPAGAPPPVV